MSHVRNFLPFLEDMDYELSHSRDSAGMTAAPAEPFPFTEMEKSVETLHEISSQRSEFLLPPATNVPYPHTMQTMTEYFNYSASFVTNSTVSEVCIPRRLKPSLDLEYPLVLLIFGLPIIVVLGTIGNILSIIVLKRRVMQMGAASFYLIVLTIPDLSVLYFSALKTWIRLVFGFELMHLSNIACKVSKYIFFTSLHLSAWLVVAITVERLMVVIFPFKASKICCHRQAQLITALLVVIIMGVNINILWASELVIENCSYKCTAKYPAKYMHHVFPWINAFVYSIVPFTLVLIMNLIIITSILKNNKLLKNLQLQQQQKVKLIQPACPTERPSRHPPSTRSSSESSATRTLRRQANKRCNLHLVHQRRLTCTLLTITILWLVLTVPYSIADLYNTIFTPPFPMEVRFICYLLMYSNHAINFYIYCLTGRKFRNELRRVFCPNWKPPVYQKVRFKQVPPLTPLPNIEGQYKEEIAMTEPRDPDKNPGFVFQDRQVRITTV